MYINLTPRFLTCESSGSNVRLEQVEIPEFNFKGLDGEDIATRRPYPNKRYQVGCRKIGKKALSGFLFDIESPPDFFSMVCKWNVGGDITLVHKINYILKEKERAAATDYMVLWSAMSPGLGGFDSRWIDEYKELSPAEAMPRMSISPDNKKGFVNDEVVKGILVFREEDFYLPTIELERLNSQIGESFRVPNTKTALVINR